VPGLGPVRLRELLTRVDPATAWRRTDTCAVSPAVVASALAEAAVGVTHLGAPDYPPELVDDFEAPAVLFHRGPLDRLGRQHRVGIIGTRRCTHYGSEVARQLGRDLAAAGIAVVSGLAAGIDAAAHEGALSAAGTTPAIGVVGSGLDVVYPRSSASLWQRIPEHGLLLSESPLGARPEPWRFPARNRIIAALCEVLVVVESHAVGGSMHTVRAALDRDVTVMAVPGSVRSSSSTGTNKLLADGVPPVLDAKDVLVALDLATAGGTADGAPIPELEPDEAQVLDALGWEPTPTEAVLVRTGLPLTQVTVLLNRLERGGFVLDQGGWWERR
jgi:DNA processing protein